MRIPHSYLALTLAFALDAGDAVQLVTLHDDPQRSRPAGAWLPYNEPVRLEAARIVCACG
jgi:hypothetical protein